MDNLTHAKKLKAFFYIYFHFHFIACFVAILLPSFDKMAHINDIDSSVLYRILLLVVGGPKKCLDEWKVQLPLLWVCRNWSNLFSSHVYSQGFINIWMNNNQSSSVEYADDDVLCKTNLGIIVGRDKYSCDYVSSLHVRVAVEPSIHQLGPVLKELLNLGVGYWINLASLDLYICMLADYDFGFKELSLEELASAFSHYIHGFKRRAPNITQLAISFPSNITISSALAILVDEYSPQIRYLHCESPLAHIPLSFSNELAYLSLKFNNNNNNNNNTNQLPRIYAQSLQTLELHNIHDGFSWWSFHNHLTPGYIEFSKLKRLKLKHLSQTDAQKTTSIKRSKHPRPYGSHMLQFPKLERLVLDSCPVDCDVFFTDTIPTQLDHLSISGGIDLLEATSRLRFSKVDKLEIELGIGDTLLNHNHYNAANYYFGMIRIGSECKLTLTSSPINPQHTMNWVNITYLEMAHIRFDQLLEHVPNLFNLRELYILQLNVGDACLSIIRAGLEAEVHGDVEMIDSRIKKLCIYRDLPEPAYEYPACANHLLLRIPTIKTFTLDTGLESQNNRVMDVLCKMFPEVSINIG